MSRLLSISCLLALVASSVNGATLTAYSDAQCTVPQPDGVDSNIKADGECFKDSLTGFYGEMTCESNGAVDLAVYLVPGCLGNSMATASGAAGSCLPIQGAPEPVWVIADCSGSGAGASTGVSAVSSTGSSPVIQASSTGSSGVVSSSTGPIVTPGTGGIVSNTSQAVGATGSVGSDTTSAAFINSTPVFMLVAALSAIAIVL